MKWHPDENPDNLDESHQKFNEIYEAFEVLFDGKAFKSLLLNCMWVTEIHYISKNIHIFTERKRRLYDQYGKDGLFNNNERQDYDDIN